MTLVIAFLAALVNQQNAPAGADLKVGDVLPNCSKIPLLEVGNEYRPQVASVHSLERHIPRDGVAIVHFTSPRPPRHAVFATTFLDELRDLQRAATSVPYPCEALAIVPFGEKGREDTLTVLQSRENPENPQLFVGYEPTYPRPGLYRTFRPSALGEGGAEITVPWTYVIGPGRKILAIRPPDSTVAIYDWLQQALPETVSPTPGVPTSDLSLPPDAPWVWPAFRRTVQHKPAASMLPDVLPYTYLAWKAPIGRTFASPVVVDNVVYANSDSQGLQSLSLASGQALLSHNIGQSWWTSPVVAGNTVYTISKDGVIHAVDRGSFEAIWKRDIEGLVTSSPVINEGTLYVGSRNGAVYAIDAINGEILWKFQTGGEVSSSPAIANGTLVIGSGDRSIYGLDAKTGAFKWATPTSGPVDSSPAVADGSVFVGSFDGGLYSIKLADGSLNWRCELGGWVHSSPVVDEDKVFVGTVNLRRDEAPTFNWVDKATGKRLGSFDMGGPVYSSPTIWGDLVLIGCRDQHLYAFDRKMRQTQPAWTFKTRSYVHASPVVVGDTVLIASYEGQLYALRQAKPIRTWKEDDIVPRWFVAALTRELHKEVGDLVTKAAASPVGTVLTLKKFEDVYADIRNNGLKTIPKALPGDVPPEHPGAPYIEYVLTSSLLTGYPDGTFLPNEPTTRYQFSFGLSTVVQTVSRPDFAWKYINKAGATVEVRIQPVVGRPQIMPRDVNDNHWAFRALADLAARALLPLDEEGNYRGGRTLTVKDAAVHWNLYVEAVKVVRTK